MLKCEMKDCTGCGACVFSCPTKAIVAKASAEGFLYPSVDRQLCINCGLCNTVCPVITKKVVSDKKRCYAVQIENPTVLSNCASGGAFWGIANNVIKNGGIVFGVKDQGKDLVYTKAESVLELEQLIGSKYYQCRMSEENYYDIVESTNKNLTLVSGTPCMVSAIKNLNGLNKENLITFEIFCQGVPDKVVIEKFYKEKEMIEKSNLIHHSFRAKDFYVGRNYLNRYEYENGKIEYLVGEEDPLSLSFQRQIFLRESCYRCHYANEERIADFTAGDLWKHDSNTIRIKEGCSVLLCNSDRAIQIFQKARGLTFVEINPDVALENIIPFHHPVKRPLCRNWSYKLLNSKMSPKIVTWICCYKYFLKQLIKGEK